jgi:hypothetical protein
MMRMGQNLSNEVIWKFEITPAVAREGSISLPRGAQILSVGTQGDSVCLWARVNKHERRASQRRVAVVATGDVVPENVDLLGRVDVFPEGLVFHVFIGEEDA